MARRPARFRHHPDPKSKYEEVLVRPIDSNSGTTAPGLAQGKQAPPAFAPAFCAWATSTGTMWCHATQPRFYWMSGTTCTYPLTAPQAISRLARNVPFAEWSLAHAQAIQALLDAYVTAATTGDGLPYHHAREALYQLGRRPAARPRSLDLQDDEAAAAALALERAPAPELPLVP